MHKFIARTAASVFGLALIVALSACGDRSSPPVVAGPAPDSFRVAFETNRGTFVVEVRRAWAPKGADRFHELVGAQFFDDNRFFRVLPGFIAQFGANGKKEVNEAWDGRTIADDPSVEKNVKGTLTFAHSGPDTRAHQLFINLKDNASLDTQGFAPIGRVVEGMTVVESIYDDYGETPKYHLIATLGNSYLNRMFPKLDYIKTARVVGAAPAPVP